MNSRGCVLNGRKLPSIQHATGCDHVTEIACGLLLLKRKCLAEWSSTHARNRMYFLLGSYKSRGTRRSRSHSTRLPLRVFQLVMDVFPDCLSPSVSPLQLNDENLDSIEHAARLGQVLAFIAYQEQRHMRVFFTTIDGSWFKSNKLRDNFQRCVAEAQQCNPNPSRWDKIVKKLAKNPQRMLKNSDQRLSFRHENVFIVKQGFTFGLRKVGAGTKHVYQTSDAPMQVFVLENTMKEACTVRRSFRPEEQYLYDMYAFRPWRCYTIPEGVRYIIVSAQKTIFSCDVVLDQCHVPDAYDYKTHRNFKRKCYNLPPPSPVKEDEPPRKKAKVSLPPAETCSEVRPEDVRPPEKDSCLQSGPPETPAPTLRQEQVFLPPSQHVLLPPPGYVFFIPQTNGPMSQLLIPEETCDQEAEFQRLMQDLEASIPFISETSDVPSELCDAPQNCAVPSELSDVPSKHFDIPHEPLDLRTAKRCCSETKCALAFQKPLDLSVKSNVVV